MPQISYRANLSSAIFPLSLSSAGATVIVPGPDNNYDRRVDPEGEQKDAGIPQAIYLENVIPTANGYQSVGLKDLGPDTSFATGLRIYDFALIDGYTYVFGRVGDATDYVYRSLDLVTWTDVSFDWLLVFGIIGPPTPGFPPIDSSLILSQAFIRGTRYVFDKNSQNLASVSGTTITLEALFVNVNSIVSSYNYLIKINADGSVAWSSTTNELDFTPSLVTGAGSATPEAVRGDIIAAYRCPEGFILYTETNAVLAKYTGNSRYPWKFTEISNSGGHNLKTLITAPEDSKYHFTVNAHGNINQISADGAYLIAPEISTYLRTAKGTYDLYNPTTRSIDTITSYLYSYQITFVANRYLFLHLTNNHLDDAGIQTRQVIVYDIHLKRYGKLGANYLFSWTDGSDVYCLTQDNRVGKIIFDTHDTDVLYPGTLILGKFQYVRSRRMELNEVIFEGEFEDISVSVLSSTDRSIPLVGTELIPYQSTDTIYACNTRAEGLNHLIILRGNFSVSTLEITFHLGGSR